MPNSFGSRLKHAWNAFFNRDPTDNLYTGTYIGGSLYNPDRVRLSVGVDRSILPAIYNRIAMDVAAVDIFHVKLDDNGRYLEKVEDGINACFSLEANIDQTGRAFVQDIVLSMLDEGCVAIVPIDTTASPLRSDSYDILSMRVGQIMQWNTTSVLVNVYNERIGQKEEIVLPKHVVGIIENPLYSVMNAPNSTLQRLIRKMSLLDMVDEKNYSGKLNMIIQFPYGIHSKIRMEQAKKRTNEIEEQLAESKHGIAYTDGTEKIIQLNRSVDNNLLSQVEYLTSMLFSQLGITQGILDGTADEKTMLNYYNRTIEPILSAITDEAKRKFLTKTARARSHSIEFFRDPFKLVPVSQISEIADKFTRNEIMTSNEIRQVIGMRPSGDPRADELRNSNLSRPADEEPMPYGLKDNEEV